MQPDADRSELERGEEVFGEPIELRCDVPKAHSLLKKALTRRLDDPPGLRSGALGRL